MTIAARRADPGPIPFWPLGAAHDLVDQLIWSGRRAVTGPHHILIRTDERELRLICGTALCI